MIDIHVTYRGARSTITFDTLPTFATFRKAIATDIVGSDAFQITGATQRGTTIVIKDQPSFIRALGPRNELHIDVREQLQVQAPPSPVRHADPARAPAATSAPRQASPSPTRQRVKTPPPTRAPTDAVLGRHGVECATVIEGGDLKCSATVKSLKQVWTGERDTGAITIRDAVKGTIVRTIKPWHSAQGPQLGCLAMCHSPPIRKAGQDGWAAPHGLVWAGFNNKHIKVYDAATYAELKTFVEHSGAVTALAAVGGSVFSASVDFTILQWHPETLTLTRLLAKHRNGVRALCAGPLQRLVSAGDDQMICLWHAQTGELIAEVPGAHSTGVHALTLHRRRLWSGDERGVVKAWTIAPAAAASAGSGAAGSMVFACDAQFAEHTAGVTEVVGFGSRMITVAQDKKMSLIDAERLTVVGHVLHPHDGAIMTVAPAAQQTLFRFWTGGPDRKWCSWSVEDDGSDAGGAAAQEPRAFEAVQDTTPAPHSAATDPELTTARLDVERGSERALIVSEEAKTRAEVYLLREKVTAERFFTSHSVARNKFVEVAVNSHAQLGAICLETYELASAMSNRFIDTATAHVIANDAVMARNQAMHDQQRREMEKQRTVMQEQLKAAHEELAALHDTYEATVEERDTVTAQRDAAKREITKLEDDVRYAKDETKLAQKRQQTLEGQLTATQDELAKEKREHDRAVVQLEATWQQRVDELSEKNHELRTQVDALERDLRRSKAEHAAERDAHESTSRKLATQIETAKTLDEQRTAAAERDRAFWQQQLDDTEEQLSKLKVAMETKQTEHTGEVTRLSGEIRDLKAKNRQLEDDVAAQQRRYATLEKDSENEAAALQAQLDEARKAWQDEVAKLEVALAAKANALAESEASVRDVDNQLVAAKSQLAAATHKNDLAQSEIQRLQEQLNTETAMHEAQAEQQLEATRAAKAELSACEQTLAAERGVRADLDRRLAAAEEHFETARRKHAEELAAEREERQREAQQLISKYKAQGDAAESRERELLADVDTARHQTHMAQREAADAKAQVMSAEETADFLTRKNAALSQQLSEETQRHAEEVAGLHRSLDSRRAEIDELRESSTNELLRLQVELRNKTESEADLTEAVRGLDLRAHALASELDQEKRKNADLTSDLRRAVDRAQSDRASGEKHTTELKAQLDELRANHDVAVADLDRTRTERDTEARGRKDAETAHAAAKDELARKEARHAVAVHERDTELERLRGEHRDSERNVVSLRTQVHDLELELSNAKRAHTNELDEKRRTHRQELESVRDAKDRAEQSVRRLEQQLQAKKEELEARTADEEHHRHQLEGSLADAKRESAQLRVDLQDAKATIATERDRYERETRSLREQLEDASTTAHAERRKYEAAIEDRRAADKRFAETIEECKVNHAKESASAQQAHLQQRQKLADQLEELQGQHRQLAAELQLTKDNLDRTEISLAEKERALQIAQRDGDLKASQLQQEIDAAKRADTARSLEHQEQLRALKRELETEREALTRERAENAETSSALRTCETELASARAEVERETRKCTELTSDLRRAQDRGSSDREALDAKIRELNATVDVERNLKNKAQEQLDERSVEVMKLETEVRELTEKVRQGNDMAERWRGRAQEAQVAKEKAIAEAAAERAEQDERRLQREREVHDENASTASALQQKQLQNDELVREVARLKRDIAELTDKHTDAGRKSSVLLQERSDEVTALEAQVSSLHGQLVAASENSTSADRVAQQYRDEAASLRAQLEDARLKIEDESRARQEAADSYHRCITDVETECTELRRSVHMAQADKAALEQSVNDGAAMRLHYDRSVAEAMQMADIVLSAVDEKKALLDDLAQVSRVQAENAQREWREQAVASDRSSAQLAGELQRMSAELSSARNERDRLARAAATNDQLLSDVRDEMANVYQKYRAECADHDATRAELAVANTGQRTESMTIALREQEQRLRGQLSALQADRDALQAKYDLLAADVRASTGSFRAGSTPHDLGGSSNKPMHPRDRFVLDTRRDMVSHMRELIEGLGEAKILMAALGRVPPATPSDDNLRCVYGWLNSAVARGEIVRRNLFTDEERAQSSQAAGSMSPRRRY